MKLKSMLPNKRTEILHGMEGMVAAATASDTHMVVAAIVGAAGLVPTAAAIKAGKDIALANKETLVTAGHIIMEMVRAITSSFTLSTASTALFFNPCKAIEKTM